MHRQPLISDLEEYQSFNEAEESDRQKILTFVKAHPKCFLREQLSGHITASAFIYDPVADRVLLMNHRKLKKWLQPGGHADGYSDTQEVARKEVEEETGLKDFSLGKMGIFDVDVHTIPARKNISEHLHYDVRYLFFADSQKPFYRNHESTDMKWISLRDLEALHIDDNILRMANKACQSQ